MQDLTPKRAEVVGTRALIPDVIEVELRMVAPAALDFRAGQWVSVPFGPKVVRVYSMASPPTRRGTITWSVDVSPGGIGSQWVRGLKPGDPVEFKGPSGGFVVTRADPRRVLFVAEEIGVAPVRSILMDLYETGFGRPTGLIFWARDPSWLVYDADFRSMSRRYPSFSYFPAVREAPAGWRGERGEAPAVVDRLVHSVDRLLVYVCGGEGTIKQVRDVLVRKGMDRKSVRWEKFW